jgi:hypothetical protein
MAGPSQGIQVETFEPIDLEYLFTVDSNGESDARPLNEAVFNGGNWVRLNKEGVSLRAPAIGDEDPAVREGRRLLVGALCTYGSLYPFNVADSKASHALQDLQEAEKALTQALGDHSPEGGFEDQKESIAKRQADYRNNLTEDLNHVIDSEQSGLAVSVVSQNRLYSPGRHGLSGLALLHSLTFEGVGPKKMTPIVRPVVATGDGNLGTLPEGQAVKGVFARAA